MTTPTASEQRLARRVRSPRVVNVADLRDLARRRLPAVVFGYLDGGAEGEVTLRENVRAFEDVTFRPRQCTPVAECDLRTTVLGQSIAMPIVLAPVGFSRMFFPQGERQACRAAHMAGTVYTLSSLAGTKLEEVAADRSGPLWYQLYVPLGRTVAEQTIARAKAAGYSALVVTIDTPVSGLRERDLRLGAASLLSRNPLAGVRYWGQLVTRPEWVAGYVADGAVRVFPNIEQPDGGAMPASDAAKFLDRTGLQWSDLEWMKRAWGGPVVVKGVHTADDARCAIEAGADAVVVSNHGGRQLDGVPASIRMLPEVVDAVRGRAEVLMDGGIRRGSDVAKALSLGARAVLIGRAYAWGLGAAGRPGVTRAIEMLKADLTRTMRLLGCPRVEELDRTYVNVPRDWATGA
jgi:L-lactate dehydrogenase (cytochrome)